MREKVRVLFFKLINISLATKIIFIKCKFKMKLRYDIEFNKSPVTFNQKIQFRKIYDKNPLYVICSDKYKVRDYVKEKIGEKYLIPIYIVTENLTPEQWEKLPDKFVVKANHNSGPVQIVKNKLKTDFETIEREIKKQLNSDYGLISLESFYSKIPRKIVVEELLIDERRDILQDYKIHCFNTKNGFKCFIDVISRASITGKVKSNIYDKNWNRCNFSNAELDREKVSKPSKLSELLEIAQKLSEDFDYVRTDFYIIGDKIYFGELTFCDSGGFGKFTDYKWDKMLGEYWEQVIVNR